MQVNLVLIKGIYKKRGAELHSRVCSRSRLKSAVCPHQHLPKALCIHVINFGVFFPCVPWTPVVFASSWIFVRHEAKTWVSSGFPCFP